MGSNVGVLSGLINEATPPWVVLFIGAVINSGYIKRVSVWQMCLYICIGANSQSFSNTGALVTCVKNFSESRRIVVGLLMGYVGLSGAILTQLYYAFYGKKNSKALILFIDWIPIVVYIIFLGTIRIMKLESNQQRNEIKVFYNFLYISLSLAGFLMILIVLQNRLIFTRVEYNATTSVVICLLFLPLLIVVKEEYNSSLATPREWSDTTLEVVDERKVEPPRIEETSNDDQMDHISCLANIFKPPNRGEDYTILQALFSIDMLILFMATICVLGGTLTAVDNMGQIWRSLGKIFGQHNP